MDIYGKYTLKDNNGTILSEGHNLVVNSGRKLLAGLIKPLNSLNISAAEFQFSPDVQAPVASDDISIFTYINEDTNFKFPELSDDLKYTFTISVNNSSLKDKANGSADTHSKLIGSAGLILTVNGEKVLFSRFSFSSLIMVSANTSMTLEYTLYF